MIWFWSDTHFDHNKVIEFCARPFTSVEEMNRVLIENYRKKVQKEDTVYFLGDIFFGTYYQALDIMLQLPGKKRLIQGNHDKFSQQQYLSLGFELVLEEAVIRLFGKRIHLCHYPRRPSRFKLLVDRVLKRDMRYVDRRRPKDNRWLLHGHTHSKSRINPGMKSIHVGVDAWDYSPISVTQIESLIAKAEKTKTKT